MCRMICHGGASLHCAPVRNLLPGLAAVRLCYLGLQILRLEAVVTYVDARCLPSSSPVLLFLGSFLGVVVHIASLIQLACGALAIQPRKRHRSAEQVIVADLLLSRDHADGRLPWLQLMVVPLSMAGLALELLSGVSSAALPCSRLMSLFLLLSIIVQGNPLLEVLPQLGAALALDFAAFLAALLTGRYHSPHLVLQHLVTTVAAAAAVLVLTPLYNWFYPTECRQGQQREEQQQERLWQRHGPEARAAHQQPDRGRSGGDSGSSLATSGSSASMAALPEAGQRRSLAAGMAAAACGGDGAALERPLASLPPDILQCPEWRLLPSYRRKVLIERMISSMLLTYGALRGPAMGPASSAGSIRGWQPTGHSAAAGAVFSIDKSPLQRAQEATAILISVAASTLLLLNGLVAQLPGRIYDEYTAVINATVTFIHAASQLTQLLAAPQPRSRGLLVQMMALLTANLVGNGDSWVTFLVQLLTLLGLVSALDVGLTWAAPASALAQLSTPAVSLQEGASGSVGLGGTGSLGTIADASAATAASAVLPSWFLWPAVAQIQGQVAAAHGGAIYCRPHASASLSGSAAGAVSVRTSHWLPLCCYALIAGVGAGLYGSLSRGKHVRLFRLYRKFYLPASYGGAYVVVPVPADEVRQLRAACSGLATAADASDADLHGGRAVAAAAASGRDVNDLDTGSGGGAKVAGVAPIRRERRRHTGRRSVSLSSMVGFGRGGGGAGTAAAAPAAAGSGDSGGGADVAGMTPIRRERRQHTGRRSVSLSSMVGFGRGGGGAGTAAAAAAAAGSGGITARVSSHSVPAGLTSAPSSEAFVSDQAAMEARGSGGGPAGHLPGKANAPWASRDTGASALAVAAAAAMGMGMHSTSRVASPMLSTRGSPFFTRSAPPLDLSDTDMAAAAAAAAAGALLGSSVPSGTTWVPVAALPVTSVVSHTGATDGGGEGSGDQHQLFDNERSGSVLASALDLDEADIISGKIDLPKQLSKLAELGASGPAARDLDRFLQMLGSNSSAATMGPAAGGGDRPRRTISRRSSDISNLGSIHTSHSIRTTFSGLPMDLRATPQARIATGPVACTAGSGVRSGGSFLESFAASIASGPSAFGGYNGSEQAPLPGPHMTRLRAAPARASSDLQHRSLHMPSGPYHPHASPYPGQHHSTPREHRLPRRSPSDVSYLGPRHRSAVVTGGLMHGAQPAPPPPGHTRLASGTPFSPPQATRLNPQQGALVQQLQKGEAAAGRGMPGAGGAGAVWHASAAAAAGAPARLLGPQIRRQPSRQASRQYSALIDSTGLALLGQNLITIGGSSGGPNHAQLLLTSLPSPVVFERFTAAGFAAGGAIIGPVDEAASFTGDAMLSSDPAEVDPYGAFNFLEPVQAPRPAGTTPATAVAPQRTVVGGAAAAARAEAEAGALANFAGESAEASFRPVPFLGRPAPGQQPGAGRGPAPVSRASFTDHQHQRMSYQQQQPPHQHHQTHTQSSPQPMPAAATTATTNSTAEDGAVDLLPYSRSPPALEPPPAPLAQSPLPVHPPPPEQQQRSGTRASSSFHALLFTPHLHRNSHTHSLSRAETDPQLGGSLSLRQVVDNRVSSSSIIEERPVGRGSSSRAKTRVSWSDMETRGSGASTGTASVTSKTSVMLVVDPTGSGPAPPLPPASARTVSTGQPGAAPTLVSVQSVPHEPSGQEAGSPVAAHDLSHENRQLRPQRQLTWPSPPLPPRGSGEVSDASTAAEREQIRAARELAVMWASSSIGDIPSSQQSSCVPSSATAGSNNPHRLAGQAAGFLAAVAPVPLAAVATGGTADDGGADRILSAVQEVLGAEHALLLQRRGSTRQRRLSQVMSPGPPLESSSRPGSRSQQPPLQLQQQTTGLAPATAAPLAGAASAGSKSPVARGDGGSGGSAARGAAVASDTNAVAAARASQGVGSTAGGSVSSVVGGASTAMSFDNWATADDLAAMLLGPRALGSGGNGTPTLGSCGSFSRRSLPVGAGPAPSGARPQSSERNQLPPPPYSRDGSGGGGAAALVMGPAPRVPVRNPSLLSRASSGLGGSSSQVTPAGSAEAGGARAGGAVGRADLAAVLDHIAGASRDQLSTAAPLHRAAGATGDQMALGPQRFATHAQLGPMTGGMMGYGADSSQWQEADRVMPLRSPSVPNMGRAHSRLMAHGFVRRTSSMGKSRLGSMASTSSSSVAMLHTGAPTSPVVTGPGGTGATAAALCSLLPDQPSSPHGLSNPNPNLPGSTSPNGWADTLDSYAHLPPMRASQTQLALALPASSLRGSVLGIRGPDGMMGLTGSGMAGRTGKRSIAKGLVEAGATVSGPAGWAQDSQPVRRAPFGRSSLDERLFKQVVTARMLQTSSSFGPAPRQPRSRRRSVGALAPLEYIPSRLSLDGKAVRAATAAAAQQQQHAASGSPPLLAGALGAVAAQQRSRSPVSGPDPGRPAGSDPLGRRSMPPRTTSRLEDPRNAALIAYAHRRGQDNFLLVQHPLLPHGAGLAGARGSADGAGLQAPYAPVDAQRSSVAGSVATAVTASSTSLQSLADVALGGFNYF